jgi:AmiR/NasT family two-component response regulator
MAQDKNIKTQKLDKRAAKLRDNLKRRKEVAKAKEQKKVEK